MQNYELDVIKTVLGLLRKDYTTKDETIALVILIDCYLRINSEEAVEDIKRAA